MSLEFQTHVQFLCIGASFQGTLKSGLNGGQDHLLKRALLRERL